MTAKKQLFIEINSEKSSNQNSNMQDDYNKTYFNNFTNIHKANQMSNFNSQSTPKNKSISNIQNYQNFNPFSTTKHLNKDKSSNFKPNTVGYKHVNNNIYSIPTKTSQSFKIKNHILKANTTKPNFSSKELNNVSRINTEEDFSNNNQLDPFTNILNTDSNINEFSNKRKNKANITNADNNGKNDDKNNDKKINNNLLYNKSRLRQDIENYNLKLINEKIISDSNLKSEIIKSLNNENIVLKNELINMKIEMNNLLEKIKNKDFLNGVKTSRNNYSMQKTNRAYRDFSNINNAYPSVYSNKKIDNNYSRNIDLAKNKTKSLINNTNINSNANNSNFNHTNSTYDSNMISNRNYTEEICNKNHLKNATMNENSKNIEYIEEIRNNISHDNIKNNDNKLAQNSMAKDYRGSVINEVNENTDDLNFKKELEVLNENTNSEEMSQFEINSENMETDNIDKTSTYKDRNNTDINHMSLNSFNNKTKNNLSPIRYDKSKIKKVEILKNEDHRRFTAYDTFNGESSNQVKNMQNANSISKSQNKAINSPEKINQNSIHFNNQDSITKNFDNINLPNIITNSKHINLKSLNSNTGYSKTGVNMNSSKNSSNFNDNKTKKHKNSISINNGINSINNLNENAHKNINFAKKLSTINNKELLQLQRRITHSYINMPVFNNLSQNNLVYLNSVTPSNKTFNPNNNILGNPLNNKNTVLLSTKESKNPGIRPSVLFNNTGINFYNDLKLSSLGNSNNKLDSVLLKVNGPIPLLKYNLQHVRMVFSELLKYQKCISSLENFNQLFSNPTEESNNNSYLKTDKINYNNDIENEIITKEEVFYVIKCLVNDFKNLVKHQLVTNKLLKSQQKLNGKHNINEIYSVISNVANSICPCEKIILFLYDKKNQEFFTKMPLDQYKELKIPVKDGFLNNVLNDGKTIVLDQAMKHPDFPKGFKTINKILDIKSQSIMVVPIFYYGDSGIKSYNTHDNKKGHNSNINTGIAKLSNKTTKYNNTFYRKLMGIIYFINKKTIDTNIPQEKENNAMDNNTAMSFKSPSTFNDNIKTNNKYVQITEPNSNPSFNMDDESISIIFSKQVSNLISFAYDLNEIANQDYKLNKAVSLIQRLMSEKKEMIYWILINSLKKIFLTEQVQVIIPVKNNKKTDASNLNSDHQKSNNKLNNICIDNYSFLRISDGKETFVSKVSGLIGHVFNSKHYYFVYDSKNSMLYNPMIDLEAANMIYTFPIINKNLEIKAIVQFEYSPLRVPWDNDGLIHSLSSYDNDIIDMINTSVNKLLEIENKVPTSSKNVIEYAQ